METNLLWIMSVGVLGVSCVFMFGILIRNFNEWYYVTRQRRRALPPGDMGWPVVRNMWRFFRAFKSGDSDSFIYNMVQSDSVVGLMNKYYSDLNAGMKAFAIKIPGFAFYRALQARKMLVRTLQGRLNESRGWMKSDVAKRGMIDLLMEVEDENRKKLEDEDITDLLLVFLLAGHESSAHGGMWAILYLHEHPEILHKAKVVAELGLYNQNVYSINLREEQLEIIKRRPSTQKGLTLNEVKQMCYLAKVIDEMLRKTNVPLCNFRQAKVDVKLNGYTIPKGWKVLIWKRGVHMDPENYLNPYEFDPSRWDPEVLLKQTHRPRAGSFIPFGLGSRICPGADLAKLEIAIFLHHFLLNYKLELVNPGSKVTCLPIPRPVDNCLAKIIKLP